MTSPNSSYRLDALVRGLKTLLGSLPSEEEKRELVRMLGEAEAFIRELQSLIESIPTMESSRALSEGLSRLDVLAERASSESGLKKILGLRGSAASRPPRRLNSIEIRIDVDRLLQMFDQMETADITTLLEHTPPPLSVLVELATRLGMRTQSKERRLDLAKRIAAYITNQRGYDVLGGKMGNSSAS